MNSSYKYLVLICVLFSIEMTGQLKINEISAHRGYVDGDIECDWIEIINTGPSELNLSSYYLSDNIDDLQKWQFPDYNIQPSEILLICASGEDITVKADHWESIILAENEWKYRPGTSSPPSSWNTVSFNDNSWSSGPGGFGYGDGDDQTTLTSIISVYLRKTFNIENLNDLTDLILHADYDDAYVAYINGEEISRSNNISGIPPSNSTTASTDHEASLYQGFLPEVVELDLEDMSAILVEGENVLAIQVHNTSIISSDLSSNFYLSAGIKPAESLYQQLPIWFETSDFASQYHTNFKLTVGETLTLSDQNGIVLDGLAVSSNLGYGLSNGRSPDGSDNWCFFDAPTPGESNLGSWCYEGVTPSPVFNLPSGWYQTNEMLDITSDNGSIYFTANGDIPDQNDALFSVPISIDETKIISARAFSNDNLLPSKTVDRTYIFNQDNYGLPVFSVFTDSLNLWDWEEGIYVSGPNAGPTYPYFGSNFWEPWSKFSRVEYFNAAKQKMAEEELDLEIHGGWSRAEAQKSFRFDFKSSYSGRLEVPLFSQKPEIEDVNNINIRNGGQHVWSDKIQDGLISRIVNSTHVDNMAYEPCILYLNGDYWGIYGTREKIDEHYVESNHNHPSDEINLLNSFGTLAGTDEHFLETYDLIINEPANSSDFYLLADSRFDLDNYKDYFIIETYIQNMDWLGIAWGANNIKLWKPETVDGKWRYVLFDTDAALGAFGQNVFANYLASARNPAFPNNHSQLFNKLLLNNQFKCEFANRYADLINTIFQPDNFTQVSSQIFAKLVLAMPDQIARWGGPSSMNQWQNDIASISQYNGSRISTARNHVNSNLGLDGQVDITLEVDPPGSGKIKISTIVPNSYPWEGVYFNGCPVSIEAIPNDGFYFESWSENMILGTTSAEQNLFLELSIDDTFTANFTQNPTSITDIPDRPQLPVFPNPSNGIFTLINTEEFELNVDLKIFNAFGEIILQSSNKKFNSKGHLPIDLSRFSKGVYFMELNDSEGTYRHKLILQ